MPNGETREIDTIKETLTPHKYAEIIPKMSEEQYAELKADIKLHGQRDPIVVLDNEIVDGVHRWKACRELKRPCLAVDWAGSKDDLLDFVISRNVKRRHLTPSELAEVGFRLLPFCKARAKKRMSVGGQKGGKNKNKGSAPALTPSSKKVKKSAIDEAAKMVGISGRTLQSFQKVVEEAPELVKHITAGHLDVKNGELLTKLDEHKREALLQEAEDGGWEKGWTKAVRAAVQEQKQQAKPTEEHGEPTDEDYAVAVSKCMELAKGLLEQVQSCSKLGQFLGVIPDKEPAMHSLLSTIHEAWKLVRSMYKGEDKPSKRTSERTDAPTDEASAPQ
jgi:hypothetical protein